jgi:hypothetical protein
MTEPAILLSMLALCGAHGLVKALSDCRGAVSVNVQSRAVMIRGSIEIARRTQITGWIYAEPGTVRDRLILAFVGERCVGAGKVDLFRKDLFDAQLGDGFCGFDFPIKLNDEEAAASVIVKLQNSDAALIQRDTRVLSADDEEPALRRPDLGAVTRDMLPWMQDRGWLEQHEFDFLRAVQTVGAYERGLRPPRRQNAELQPALRPEQVAHELLSLFVMSDIDLTRSKLASVSDLANDGSPLRRKGVPVMALWSTERCRICLDERSHMRMIESAPGTTVSAVPPPGGIEYGFGPDRVLFVHRGISFAPQGVAPREGIMVFTATLRDNEFQAGLRRTEKAA